MGQLLVRGLDERLIRKLKARARAHGVSAEEEHRQILQEALLRGRDSRPTLMEYLSSAEGTVYPDVELDLDRGKESGERETGI